MFSSEIFLLSHVEKQTKNSFQGLIAIDEVGRGCVAGPVLTCATVWIPCQTKTAQNWAPFVKDSKKLSPKKRLFCYEEVLQEFNLTNSTAPIQNSHTLPLLKLCKPKYILPFESISEKYSNIKQTTPPMECVAFCFGESNMAEVDSYNIWNAVQLAASRALVGLKENSLIKLNISEQNCLILMDGNKSISVPKMYENCLQTTAIKGDDIFLSIGLSSILAKVHRDIFMDSQEKLYPKFGFSKHKGYGTSFHLEKILEHGTCPLHRLSFLKNYL